MLTKKSKNKVNKKGMNEVLNKRDEHWRDLCSYPATSTS